MTTYTNIRKKAKQAFYDVITASDTGFSDDFKSVQIIKEFDNTREPESRRILIGANVSPAIVGATNIGWTVDLVIQVVSHFSKYTEAQHEALCDPIEATMFWSGLAAAMSDSEFVVTVATPGTNPLDDFQDDERISEYHMELECHLTGV